MPERIADIVFEPHLASDQKQVIELDGRGEEHDITAVTGDVCHCFAERAEVVRQLPAVEGDCGYLGSELLKSGMQLRVETAVFLHGDAPLRSVADSFDDFAPGIGFGNNHMHGDVERTQDADWLGAS